MKNNENFPLKTRDVIVETSRLKTNFDLEIFSSSTKTNEGWPQKISQFYSHKTLLRAQSRDENENLSKKRSDFNNNIRLKKIIKQAKTCETGTFRQWLRRFKLEKKFSSALHFNAALTLGTACVHFSHFFSKFFSHFFQIFFRIFSKFFPNFFFPFFSRFFPFF